MQPATGAAFHLSGGFQPGYPLLRIHAEDEGSAADCPRIQDTHGKHVPGTHVCAQHTRGAGLCSVAVRPAELGSLAEVSEVVELGRIPLGSQWGTGGRRRPPLGFPSSPSTEKLEQRPLDAVQLALSAKIVPRSMVVLNYLRVSNIFSEFVFSSPQKCSIPGKGPQPLAATVQVPSSLGQDSWACRKCCVLACF